MLLTESEEEVREIRQQLRDALEALREPTLRGFLENPAVSAYKRADALVEVFDKGGMNRRLTMFMKLVELKGRMRYLEEIVEEFETLARQRLGEQVVVAESAYPLDDEEREALVDVLGRRVGKRVILREKVVPELMAGLRLKMGDLVMDASARMRLEALERELVRED